ncbi:hypothetical protein HYH03_016589 [Edaphochlamys debaryana]|uniref:PDEase domain-containing protein n=1 Tax=Edaphochlamys debaryana TaxID=47281 RepID=A0A835XIX2_9CHLO|nr:hypothetical protein HYH03_016589 [Edaphochlamys debaryana]|eukprot:KAG2484636.1 hypothetical protein HYH03_016589 [Edaphochlamys debaryana]
MAQSHVDDEQEHARAISSDTAAWYHSMLGSAFTPVLATAAMVQRNPQYATAAMLFNATAPAFMAAEAVRPMDSLELRPSGVLHAVYPEEGNEALIGTDCFLGAPDAQLLELTRYAAAQGQLSVAGPMPVPSAPALAAATEAGSSLAAVLAPAVRQHASYVLVVRKGIRVPVANASAAGAELGLPSQATPVCGQACEYDPATGTVFWGFASASIMMDSLGAPAGARGQASPLGSLADRGYRYELTSTDGLRIAASEAPVQDAITATIQLPALRWTLAISPASGSWWPSWYGGAVAAVVVGSFVVSVLLFCLLVSRCHNRMLLRMLLPRQLLNELKPQHVEALGARVVAPADTPADLLSALLANLLSGELPDLRDVVLLRTVLRQGKDLYRPFDLTGKIREANLDQDVAGALMRQLGDPSNRSATWGAAVRASPSTHIHRASSIGGVGRPTPVLRSTMSSRLGNVSVATPPQHRGHGTHHSSMTEAGPAGMGSLRGALQFLLSDAAGDSGYAAGSNPTAGDDAGMSAAGWARGSIDMGEHASAANNTVSGTNMWGGTGAELDSALSDELMDALVSRQQQSQSQQGPAQSHVQDLQSPGLAGLAQQAHRHLTRSQPHQRLLVDRKPSLLRRQQLPGGGGADHDFGRSGAAEAPSPVRAGSRGGASSTAASAPSPPQPSLRPPPAAVAAQPSVTRSSLLALELAGVKGGQGRSCSGLLLQLNPASFMSGPMAYLGELDLINTHGDRDADGSSKGEQGKSRGTGGARPGARSGAGSTSFRAGTCGGYCTTGDAAAGTPALTRSPSTRSAIAATPTAPLQGSQPAAASAAAAAVSVSVSSFPAPSQHPRSNPAFRLQLLDPVRRVLTARHSFRKPPSGDAAQAPAAAATKPAGSASSTLTAGSTAEQATASPAVARAVIRPGSSPSTAQYAGTMPPPSNVLLSANIKAAAVGSLEECEAAGIIVGKGHAAREGRGGEGLSGAVAVTPVPLPLPLDEIERLLADAVSSWQFDMFQLAEVTGGHAMSCLGYYLMQREGIIRRFGFHAATMARLLRALETGYNDNPYHNSTHAADVLRSLHVLLMGTRLTDHYLDPLGLLAAYLAAMIHDLDHPGLTGDFLVATSHTLALRYNDRSPLESHHSSATFTLLAERPDLDALAPLSGEQRAALRKIVVDMVMGTDMKQHFALISQFKTAHPPQSPNPPALPLLPSPTAQPNDKKCGDGEIRRGISSGSFSDRGSGLPGGLAPGLGPKPLDDVERTLTLQIALKVADIGHLGAELAVHKRWLGVLEEEFFRQGDREKALGLPISPLFDRTKQGASKSQVGFYDFVALPLVRALAEAFPGAQPMQACFEANYAFWAGAVAAAGPTSASQQQPAAAAPAASPRDPAALPAAVEESPVLELPIPQVDGGKTVQSVAATKQ